MATSFATIRVSGFRKGKLAALRAQAKALGMTAEDYAKQLIEDGIAVERQARSRSFDQLFAPVQQQFRDGKISEEELDVLVESIRVKHNKANSRKTA